MEEPFAPYVWHVTNGITTVNGIAPTGHIRIIRYVATNADDPRLVGAKRLQRADSGARMRENIELNAPGIKVNAR